MADTFDVIMAGYQAIEPAKKDFDGLVQLVKDKQVKSEGNHSRGARRERRGPRLADR